MKNLIHYSLHSFYHINEAILEEERQPDGKTPANEKGFRIICADNNNIFKN